MCKYKRSLTKIETSYIVAGFFFFLVFFLNGTVEEDFGLKMRSGELAGERYKAKRKVVLTFWSIFIVFFTQRL